MINVRTITFNQKRFLKCHKLIKRSTILKKYFHTIINDHAHKIIYAYAF